MAQYKHKRTHNQHARLVHRGFRLLRSVWAEKRLDRSPLIHGTVALRHLGINGDLSTVTIRKSNFRSFGLHFAIRHSRSRTPRSTVAAQGPAPEAVSKGSKVMFLIERNLGH
jgi:hypothetical protein